MTVDKIVYNYINDNLLFAGSFVYGSAEGVSTPYIVMHKIDDAERPDTLCVEQGAQGEALFQFNGYTEGGPGAIIEYLNDFKIQVAQIGGVIGTAPDEVEIWYNKTGGVRLIGDGASIGQVWGVLFEAEFFWRYV